MSDPDFWRMLTLVFDQQLDAVWRRGVQDALELLPPGPQGDRLRTALSRLRDRGPRVPDPPHDDATG